MHNQYKISGSAKYHKIKTLVIEKWNMDYNEAMKPLNFFKSNYMLKLEKEKLMR
jgi:hypothetical protein